MEAIINVGDEAIPATTIDISQGGIGLEALKSIPPGTPATIVLSIPENVTFYGNLMWSQHTLVSNLDAYDMGFEVFAINYDGRILDGLAQEEEIVQTILAKAGEIS